MNRLRKDVMKFLLARGCGTNFSEVAYKRTILNGTLLEAYELYYIRLREKTVLKGSRFRMGKDHHSVLVGWLNPP